jgi:transcriptional regulator with XRE-family HTH domain
LKSIYSAEYKLLLELLIRARKEAGTTQQELAKQLKRPQSFVSKVERGERRLDVIEFLNIGRLVKADPYVLLHQVEGKRRKTK